MDSVKVIIFISNIRVIRQKFIIAESSKEVYNVDEIRRNRDLKLRINIVNSTVFTNQSRADTHALTVDPMTQEPHIQRCRWPGELQIDSVLDSDGII